MYEVRMTSLHYIHYIRVFPFRSLWSMRNYIHIMLCVNLIIAQLIFIIGIDKTENMVCINIDIVDIYIIMYVCMYKSDVYTYMYYTFICTFKHSYIHMYMHAYIRTHTHYYIYVYVHNFIYVCTYRPYIF